MSSMSLVWYTLAAAALFAKFVLTTGLQGLTRLRTKTFQYPEDAAYWRGSEPAAEVERVVRAQRLLRNDGEGQPFFLAIGLAFVLLGGPPTFSALYFSIYAVSRVVHAGFFLWPKQPHRNRAFTVGMLALIALTVHALVLTASR